MTPRRDRRAPFRFRTTGRLLPPAGVSPSLGCAGWRVAVQVKRGRRTISARRVALRRDCSFRSQVVFRSPRRLGRGRLRFLARFVGNGVVRPLAARTRTARVG